MKGFESKNIRLIQNNISELYNNALYYLTIFTTDFNEIYILPRHCALIPIKM